MTRGEIYLPEVEASLGNKLDSSTNRKDKHIPRKLFIGGSIIFALSAILSSCRDGNNEIGDNNSSGTQTEIPELNITPKNTAEEPTLSSTSEVTPTRTPTPIQKSSLTDSPRPTLSSTSEVTPTRTPTPTPTRISKPTTSATSEIITTSTPESTLVKTPTPTPTPESTLVKTPTPTPTPESTLVKTPTPTPTPESTLVKTPTPTPIPTPEPTRAATPIPEPTLDISSLDPDAKVLIEECISYNLFVMDIDGSDKVHIADNAQTWSWFGKSMPDLSPDGQHILVREQYDDREFSSYWNLYTSTGILLRELGHKFNEHISWIDNQNVIYNNGYGGLYMMNIQNGVETELISTRRGTLDHSGSFSPDGAKLIYAHHESGANYYISLTSSSDLPLDGEDRNNEKFNPKIRILDEGRSVYDQEFKFFWTPDGKKVVYFVDSTGNGYNSGSLKIVDIDSGNVTEITPEAIGLLNIRGYAMDLSPDGNTILFNGDNKAYTIGIDGEDFDLFADESIQESALRWSQNGNFVATEVFDSHTDGLTIYSSDGSLSMVIPGTEATCVKSFDWSG